MRITIFDTETTGLPKREGTLQDQPHVIQFASQTFEFDPLTRRFVEVDRYNQLIKPPVPVPAESTRISGITDEMVAACPVMAEVMPRILEIFRNSDLAVAHNLSFDREILENELQRLGISRNFLPPTIYDTM
jgi:DNA polymerase-3 subunit epsilon